MNDRIGADFEDAYLPSNFEISDYYEETSKFKFIKKSPHFDYTMMTRMKQLFVMIFHKEIQKKTVTDIYDVQIDEITHIQKLEKYEVGIPDIKEIVFKFVINSTLPKNEISLTIDNFVPKIAFNLPQTGDDPWAYPEYVDKVAMFSLKIDDSNVILRGAIPKQATSSKKKDKAADDKKKDKSKSPIESNLLSNIHNKLKKDLQSIARYLCILYWYKLNKTDLIAAILKTKGKQSSTRIMSKNGCVNKKSR
jgi:hypothetical protein